MGCAASSHVAGETSELSEGHAASATAGLGGSGGAIPPALTQAAPAAGAAAAGKPAVAVSVGCGLDRGSFPAPPPDNGEHERERVQAVRRLGVLHTVPDARFAAVTSLLRNVFAVPMALINILDEEQLFSMPEAAGQPGAACEWVGYKRSETACNLILRSPQPEMLVVEDLVMDARFRHLPSVAGPPHVRFYASAPLLSTDRGLRYGTICLVDLQPRRFTAQQYQLLPHFAEVVVRELERDNVLRLRQRQLASAQSELLCLTRNLDCFADGILVCDVEQEGWPVVFSNRAASLMLTQQPEQLAAGTQFWQLFGLDPAWTQPGPSSQEACSMEEVQQAVARRRPFMATCRLQAQSSTGAASAAGVDSSAGSPGMTGGSGGGGGDGVRRHSADLGGTANGGAGTNTIIEQVLTGRASLDTVHTARARFAGGGDGGSSSASAAAPVQAGADSLYTAAFRPCSEPGFPGGALVSIPALVSDAQGWQAGGGSSASTGGSPTSRQERYWFATLRPVAAPMPTVAAAAPLAAVPEAAGAAGAGAAAGAAGAGAAAGAAGAGAPSPSAPASRASSTSHDSLLSIRPEGMEDLQLGSLLGVGASGRAYRGLWHGSKVAVKIIHIEEEGEAGDREQNLMFGSSGASGSGGGSSSRRSKGGAVLLEATLSKSLAHPHIVRTHAYGICDAGSARGKTHKQIFIVQELCTRGSLAKAIETGAFQDHHTQGPDLHSILLTAAEVAGAVAYLHSMGVVHGDLTGNNILLKPSSEDQRQFTAMVADFGLSRTLDVLSEVSTGNYGTASHMPPELIIDGQLSAATDIFSFGVVLWELMAGQRAWSGMSALQVVNAVAVQGRALQVPAEWLDQMQELIRRCLAADPKQRPAAKEVLAELQRMLAPHLPSDSG